MRVEPYISIMSNETLIVLMDHATKQSYLWNTTYGTLGGANLWGRRKFVGVEPDPCALIQK